MIRRTSRYGQDKVCRLRRFRHVELAERGIALAHTTILRWKQGYVPEFEKRWAVAKLKAAGTLPRRVRVRSCKYLKNVVEQDHRRIKQRIRPMIGSSGSTRRP
jgi:transposase-like protein